MQNQQTKIDRKFAIGLFIGLKKFGTITSGRLLSKVVKNVLFRVRVCLCAVHVILSCRQMWLFVSLYVGGTTQYQKLVYVKEREKQRNRTENRSKTKVKIQTKK